MSGPVSIPRMRPTATTAVEMVSTSTVTTESLMGASCSIPYRPHSNRSWNSRWSWIMRVDFEDIGHGCIGLAVRVTARSTAFREADLVLVLGTRMNYVIAHGDPPRFHPGAEFVRIDIDPGEIDTSPRLDLGVVSDARAALEALCATGKGDPDRYVTWRERLAGRNSGRAGDHERLLANDDVPIHPLRLCAEVREFMDRDAVLVVDGQEILNYGRQAIPTHTARHRINSGVFGTMGVGLPCAIGAKLAKPEAQVIALHGDGSLGMNVMELDTAVRHDVPLLVVVSLNGGWTGDPDRDKPGRDLGYTRYDMVAKALGCHGEHVENPAGIRPVLERAQSEVDRDALRSST